jgi:hypothetical protein
MTVVLLTWWQRVRDWRAAPISPHDDARQILDDSTMRMERLRNRVIRGGPGIP